MFSREYLESASTTKKPASPTTTAPRAPAGQAPWASTGSNPWSDPWGSGSMPYGQPMRGPVDATPNPYSSLRSPGIETLVSYLNSYYSGQSGQPGQSGQLGGMGYFGWPSQGGDPRGMRYPEPAFRDAPYGQSGFGGNDPFFSHWRRQNTGPRRQAAPGEGGEAPWDPVSAGFPEAFRDPRFQEIANRYAAVSEDWRDGGRHWDPRSLQEATRRALMTFQGKTAQEIENMVGEWGIEGASGRQWLDDLNWMAEHLGMEPGQYARWTDHTRQFKADPLGEAHRAAHVMPQSRDALHENPYFKTIAEKYVAIDPRWRDMGKGWDTGELADWVAHQVKHFTSTPRHELEREAQQMGLRGFDVDQWGRDLGFLRQALAPLLDEDRASEWRMLGVGAPLSSHIPRFNVMYPDPPAQLLRSGGGVGVTQSPGRSSGFGLR